MEWARAETRVTCTCSIRSRWERSAQPEGPRATAHTAWAAGGRAAVNHTTDETGAEHLAERGAGYGPAGMRAHVDTRAGRNAFSNARVC